MCLASGTVTANFVPLFRAPTSECRTRRVYRHNRSMTDASTDRENLSWDGFGAATRDLARRIVASGFEPEVVVAIARGGLLPAGAIAYGLGAKNCGAINVEFYTGI